MLTEQNKQDIEKLRYAVQHDYNLAVVKHRILSICNLIEFTRIRNRYTRK